MEGLALFGGAALVFGALCLYVIRQGARRRRPRDPLQPAIVGGILVLLWLLANLVIPIIALVNGHWLFGMFWAVCWAAALWPGRKSRRGEPATPSPVETVVPPRGELPRTFTEPMRTPNEREYRREYRRSVNAAALLYVCGWLPGVIANWRLRRRYHLWAGVNEQKLPWAGLVEFQFWAFTVTLPLLALLVCLLALLGRTGAGPGLSWRPPRPKTGLASPVTRSSSGTPSVTVIGINDPGQVVGNVVTASAYFRAVLWQNGRMIDLGTPPGGQG
jgi:probable HAF family extracellular repeat protein